MTKLKNLGRSLLNPPASALILFYVVFILSVTGTTLIITNHLESLWLSTIIISITALSFIYGILITVLAYKKIKDKLKSKFKDKKYLKVLTTYNGRSIFFATCTFIINAVYAVFLTTLSIMSSSLWYGALTVYYVMLSINRCNLVLKYSSLAQQNLGHVETQLSKAKTYRNCGIWLLLLTTALSAFIVQMSISPQPFRHANILIYPVAIYSFYKITLAIINLFKAKKHDDIIVQASRNINFATAVVTLLTLLVNIFQVFAPERNFSTIIGIAGAFTCFIVIGLGIYMIITGQNKINNFYQIKK